MKLKGKKFPIPTKYDYTEVVPHQGQPRGTLIPCRTPGAESTSVTDGIASEVIVQPEDNTVQNQITSQGMYSISKSGFDKSAYLAKWLLMNNAQFF